MPMQLSDKSSEGTYKASKLMQHISAWIHTRPSTFLELSEARISFIYIMIDQHIYLSIRILIFFLFLFHNTLKIKMLQTQS